MPVTDVALPWVAPSSFGERLRIERARLGYSLRNLAAAAGAFGPPSPFDCVHADEVKRWHRVQGTPHGNVLALLDALTFDVPYLVAGRVSHGHYLAPTEGLGERRVSWASLMSPGGALRWPTPITWTRHDTLSAAALHEYTRHGLRTIRATHITEAFAVCLLPRLREHPPTLALERDRHEARGRLAALFDAWRLAFRLTHATVQPLEAFSVADHVLRSFAAIEKSRAA